MKLHLSNGYTYTIPKDVKYATSSFTVSRKAMSAAKFDMLAFEQEILFDNMNRKMKAFKPIGHEEFTRDDNYQEMHWFIHVRDYERCTYTRTKSD